MPTESDSSQMPHQSLTLLDLTRIMHDFVRDKGWYEPDSPRKQSPRNIATSLVIEAAEVLEHFQWNGDVADSEALAGELADVALYLLQLASIAHVDLQEAILNKLEINYNRSWE
jgi:NTP pyrophosphatase (non-canonical NTP hydrolase)